MYSHFSYDINSYIASKLESQSNGKVTEPRDQISNVADDENRHSEMNGNDNYERIKEESDDSDERSIPNADNTATMTHLPKSSNNKHISSFTVENILMGKQSSSSSASSSSSIHSPTSSSSTASLASPTGSGSVSSSIVGVNWVSHPPVKYTKFTILSPSAMSEEAQNRKKLYDISSTLKSSDGSRGAQLASSSPEISAPPKSHASDSQATLIRQGSTGSSMVVYPITSLTGSSTLKDLPVSAPLTSSGRLCTLPVVTTLPTSSSNQERKAVLSKTFPPSQQYVFLVPSSSVAVSSGLQSVVYDTSGASQTKVGQSPAPVATSVNRSQIKTISFQSSPTVTTTSSQRDDSSNVTDIRNSSANQIPPESGFRLIAPKQSINASQDNITTATGAMTTTTTTANNRSKHQKRMAIKPHKLRFHMTTVVTKQKRMPVKSSMTVESPSPIVSAGPGNASSSPPSRNHTPSSKDMLVESTITCSPNVYSNSLSKTEAPVSEEISNSELEENASSRKEVQNPRIRNGVKSASTNVHTADGSKKKVLGTSVVDPELGEATHRGRTTRSYTRRKRELTFHLYEDPGTAYRAKKVCKD